MPKPTQSTWKETPILCECTARLVTDGRSLPWCPDCLAQMTLHDLLQWLTEPVHLATPDISAEQVNLMDMLRTAQRIEFIA